METETRENTATKESWSVVHPLSREDAAALTALRSTVAGMKGKLEGTAARGPFNGIMERFAAPGVSLPRPGIQVVHGTVPQECARNTLPARSGVLYPPAIEGLRCHPLPTSSTRAPEVTPS